MREAAEDSRERGRNIEVEQDRKVIAPAEFLTQRIEHGFALIGEATEDQHPLGGDNFGDLTNFLIIQDEANKLRDLDIIDKNLRLVLRCNDQILLLGQV
jgi:hypothetical protein